MEPVEYEGGPFDAQIDTQDGMVLLRIKRDSAVLVEMHMTPARALGLSQRIEGALSRETYRNN
jgi:hypothetical protein